jgi:hypothetical protein
VKDAALLRLREHVAQDIRAGATPGDAAAVRTQALMLGFGPPASPPARRLPGTVTP